MNNLEANAPAVCDGGESFLQEPSAYSAELTAMLGVGTRTARTAMLRHGIVAAGDVVVLRDQTVAIAQAPIHREGQPHVSIIALRTQLRRSVTNSAALYDALEETIIAPQHLVQHVCVWSAEAKGILVLAPL